MFVLSRCRVRFMWDEFRRGLGCAVRFSAAADWDCCSVNKPVRGCSAAVCGWEDTASVCGSWLPSLKEQFHHVPSVVFSAQRLQFCRGTAGPDFLFLIKLYICQSAHLPLLSKCSSRRLINQMHFAAEEVSVSCVIPGKWQRSRKVQTRRTRLRPGARPCRRSGRRASASPATRAACAPAPTSW